MTKECVFCSDNLRDRDDYIPIVVAEYEQYICNRCEESLRKILKILYEEDINKIFTTLNKFKLKEGEKWELHHGDIVINSSKFREIKREFCKENGTT